MESSLRKAQEKERFMQQMDEARKLREAEKKQQQQEELAHVARLHQELESARAEQVELKQHARREMEIVMQDNEKAKGMKAMEMQKEADADRRLLVELEKKNKAEDAMKELLLKRRLEKQNRHAVALIEAQKPWQQQQREVCISLVLGQVDLLPFVFLSG